MNIERDKFLTEAMGECWHKIRRKSDLNKTFICICGFNTNHTEEYFEHVKKNNDFSTWGGFGKLWDWAIKQEWWSDFECYHWEPCGYKHILQSFINPDRFADAVYSFLKDKNETN